MTPSQKQQKERARQESQMHQQNSNVLRSNAELSDEELENRMMGREAGTSIIDQTSAGFALNNRKKAKEGK